MSANGFDEAVSAVGKLVSAVMLTALIGWQLYTGMSLSNPETTSEVGTGRVCVGTEGATVSSA